MAWKNPNEILDDVYNTLQRLRAGTVEKGQAKVEARLLDTGCRLMLAGVPLAEVRGQGVRAA